MIINEIKGDLIADFLDADSNNFDHIAHGANCFHTMGSGFARGARILIPAAFAADLRTNHGCQAKLGEYSVADVLIGRRDNKAVYRKVFNLYTQFYPGPNASAYAIASAFVFMNNYLAANPKPDGTPHRVGIPLIGCGIGGLKWEDIRPLIHEASGNTEIVVYHYQPKP